MCGLLRRQAVPRGLLTHDTAAGVNITPPTVTQRTRLWARAPVLRSAATRLSTVDWRTTPTSDRRYESFVGDYVGRGSVRRGSVRRGSVRRGSVRRGSARRGSARRGS